jgi:hypothetical protein
MELLIASIFAVILGLIFYRKQNQTARELAKIKKSLTDKVFERKIESYTADVLFDEPVEPTHDAAIIKLGPRTRAWENQIERKASNISGAIRIDGRGNGREFGFQGRTAIISYASPFLPHTYVVKHRHITCESSGFHIKTSSFELMDEILSQGKQPYWEFVWYLSAPYDILQLVSMVREATGKEAPHYTEEHVAYPLPGIDGMDFRVDIYKKSLHIVCNNRGPNQGFYHAHKVFSPTMIIQFLLGEINYAEFRQMLLKSVTKIDS